MKNLILMLVVVMAFGNEEEKYYAQKDYFGDYLCKTDEVIPGLYLGEKENKFEDYYFSQLKNNFCQASLMVKEITAVKVEHQLKKWKEILDHAPNGFSFMSSGEDKFTQLITLMDLQLEVKNQKEFLALFESLATLQRAPITAKRFHPELQDLTYDYIPRSFVLDLTSEEIEKLKIYKEEKYFQKLKKDFKSPGDLMYMRSLSILLREISYDLNLHHLLLEEYLYILRVMDLEEKREDKVSHSLLMDLLQLKMESYCRLGFRLSCWDLGRILFTAEKKMDAKNEWLKNCNDGDALSCHSLGLLLDSDGQVMDALYSYNRACEQQNSLSCYLLSLNEISAVKFEKALHYITLGHLGKSPSLMLEEKLKKFIEAKDTAPETSGDTKENWSGTVSCFGESHAIDITLKSDKVALLKVASGQVIEGEYKRDLKFRRIFDFQFPSMPPLTNIRAFLYDDQLMGMSLNQDCSLVVLKKL